MPLEHVIGVRVPARQLFMKNIISAIIILLVTAGGLYFLSKIGDYKEIEPVQFDDQGLQMPGEPTQQPTSNQEETNAYGGMTREEFWSQLRAEIAQPGEGEGAKNGDQLTVHYIGTLEDGTKFDSSVDRGQPFQVTLGAGQVIQGWELGLVGIKKGEVRRLFIPSQFGYGEQGAGDSIPPNANLIFEVQLLEIN